MAPDTTAEVKCVSYKTRCSSDVAKLAHNRQGSRLRGQESNCRKKRKRKKEMKRGRGRRGEKGKGEREEERRGGREGGRERKGVREERGRGGHKYSNSRRKGKRKRESGGREEEAPWEGVVGVVWKAGLHSGEENTYEGLGGLERSIEHKSALRPLVEVWLILYGLEPHIFLNIL